MSTLTLCIEALASILHLSSVLSLMYVATVALIRLKIYHSFLINATVATYMSDDTDERCRIEASASMRKVRVDIL